MPIVRSGTRLAVLALAAAAAAPTAASSQILKPRPRAITDLFVGGVSGFVGLPVGQFRENEDGGAGGQAFLGFQPLRAKPLVIRGDVSWLQYGRYNNDTEDEDCDLEGDCHTYVSFSDSRYHNMFTFQAGPELMATRGKWRPFAYAMTGMTLFYSQASYGDDSRTLLASHNASSAYGVGVRNVGKRFGRESGLELGLRLTRNPHAQYVNDGALGGGNGAWTVTPRLGAAHVLAIHVGLWSGPFVNWNDR
jgi:hypothetical protein